MPAELNAVSDRGDLPAGHRIREDHPRRSRLARARGRGAGGARRAGARGAAGRVAVESCRPPRRSSPPCDRRPTPTRAPTTGSRRRPRRRASSPATISCSRRRRSRRIRASWPRRSRTSRPRGRRSRRCSDMEGYLTITAPFDGVVTERNVHPGALVGPSSGGGGATPMVRLVEDRSAAARRAGARGLHRRRHAGDRRCRSPCAAYPAQTFTGTVARIAHAVDVSTRTMAVELDVANTDGRLTPGAFCQVRWPIRRTDAVAARAGRRASRARPAAASSSGSATARPSGWT